MHLLLLATLAQANPTGSPVALLEHGRVRLAAELGGESAPSQAGGNASTVTAPTRTGRLDVLLLDGLGVFVDGGWRSSTVSAAGYSGNGWTAGAGARTTVWIAGPVGLGLQGRGLYALDWDRAPDGTVDGWHRRVALRGLVTAVLGPRGEGAYAWAGVRSTAWAAEELAVVSDGLDWSIGPNRKVGGVIGGELHSDDLLGLGRTGELYASVGAELHFRDVTGGAVWLGIAR